jgi:hypothetical protein
MPRISLVCFANSIKLGGRCIAGIRADGGGWIRPVGPGDGTLYQRQYLLPDGTEPAVLDLFSLDLSRPRPRPHQRENWEFIPEQWQLLSRPAGEELAGAVRPLIVVGPELLSGRTDRVRLLDLDPERPIDSLALVSPAEVRWLKTTTSAGREQVRGLFSLGGVEYSLAVTDPIWKPYLLALQGDETGIVRLAARDRLLLTVSIGEPLNGYCYKLIAAVIKLPADWSEALSP